MNWTTFSTLVTLTHKILKKFCRCSFSWNIVEFFKAVTFSSNWSIVRESSILWKLYIKKCIYVNVAIYNLPNSIHNEAELQSFPFKYFYSKCFVTAACIWMCHSAIHNLIATCTSVRWKPILSLRTCIVCIYQILHINANDFSALPVSNICQNCML